MDYQDNVFEKRAQADINKLKERYVIDIITGERLQEIFIYLYLSQASRNQRGINLQTEKLRNVLHTCPKIISPVFSVQPSESVFSRV
jgi:hypothetical protein